MKKQEPEFQHFIFEHFVTKERARIAIGPTPISVTRLDSEIANALKDIGRDPDTKVWIVHKAWCGPAKCNPPQVKS